MRHNKELLRKQMKLLAKQSESAEERDLANLSTAMCEIYKTMRSKTALVMPEDTKETPPMEKAIDGAGAIIPRFQTVADYQSFKNFLPKREAKGIGPTIKKVKIDWTFL